VNWSALAVLAILAGLVVLGLAGQGLSLVQALVCLGFGAAVLGIASLWQDAFRRAETQPPPTHRQPMWQAVVFVVWLALMAAAVWWYVVDRAERTRQPAHPEDEPEQPAQKGDGPKVRKHQGGSAAVVVGISLDHARRPG
jgi:hypothetical protein